MRFRPIILNHPYPGNLKLTGFDVRGVFITGSDFMFPVSGRTVASGDGIAHLLNPDGYTSLFNPVEFPEFEARTSGTSIYSR